MTTNLRGILAPALTAVTDDFQIHEERTLAHFRWLLENGCDGLVVFGTTSEANSFPLSSGGDYSNGRSPWVSTRKS